MRCQCPTWLSVLTRSLFHCLLHSLDCSVMDRWLFTTSQCPCWPYLYWRGPHVCVDRVPMSDDWVPISVDPVPMCMLTGSPYLLIWSPRLCWSGPHVCIRPEGCVDRVPVSVLIGSPCLYLTRALYLCWPGHHVYIWPQRCVCGSDPSVCIWHGCCVDWNPCLVLTGYPGLLSRFLCPYWWGSHVCVVWALSILNRSLCWFQHSSVCVL